MSYTPKFGELKGDFHIMDHGTADGVFSPVFNSTTGNLNLNITTEKVKSNGNVRGTVFTYEVDREATLELTAQSRHVEMMKTTFLANAVDIAAATDAVEFTLPVMKKGQVIHLAHRNINNLTITGKVAGTDYIVWPKSGVIEAKTDIEEPAAGTYKHGAYTKLGVLSQDARDYTILFFSEKTGQSYKFYKAKGNPSGAISLLTDGSGVGTATIVFTLELDETAPMDEDLGQYGIAYNVD